MRDFWKFATKAAQAGALAICVVAIAQCSQTTIVAEVEAHTEREKPILLNGCANAKGEAS